MIFDEEILRLSAELKKNFITRNMTLAGAESCTGGLIGGAITELSGSSEYFKGSAVTYSNDAKMGLLGVSVDTLNLHGAVSSACAAEMSSGAMRVYSSDMAFSVTGIAGPEGGTDKKPVGTVWMAYSGPLGTKTICRLFPGDRSAVRLATVREALKVLLSMVKN